MNHSALLVVTGMELIELPAAAKRPEHTHKLKLQSLNEIPGHDSVPARQYSVIMKYALKSPQAIRAYNKAGFYSEILIYES